MGRGATASRPFAERSLQSRASYPDPTKTVRPRTPRRGAPTLCTRANRPVSGFPLSLSFPTPATQGLPPATWNGRH